jgi:aryl-alcohol dehydrogenase-like predicted oxidoreductase
MKYYLLGPSGLRVSEICLGTMTFGTDWKIGADRSTSQGVFDAFAEAGGNFLDTANNYSCGTGERWLGEFLKSDRDRFVLASKFSSSDRAGDPNAAGNHRKNLMRSVTGSLSRLQTDYLDLLWIHFWDFTTAPEEVLRGCEDLVRRGLVHHIGISDTPAWLVAHLQTIAHFRGWNPLIALQIEYSLLRRDAERDLLPMAEHFEMPVIPWGAIAGGALTGKYLAGGNGRLEPEHRRLAPATEPIVREVVAIAAEHGLSPAQVALAWVRQQVSRCIPLVGARLPEQLHEALAGLGVTLSPEDIKRLDQVSRIELGFPHDFLRPDHLDRLLGQTLKNLGPAPVRRVAGSG